MQPQQLHRYKNRRQWRKNLQKMQIRKITTVTVRTAQTNKLYFRPAIMNNLWGTHYSSVQTHTRFTVNWIWDIPTALSYDREHFSNTDPSDLRIVGTCHMLVYQMGHQIMWFARFVDSNLLSICVIMCHWNRFLDLAMWEMFLKMF